MLIGHHRQQTFLQRLVEDEKFPAALLLVGPPGVGKKTVSEAVARSLLQAGESRLEAHPDVVRIEFAEDQVLRETLVRLLRAVHERPMRAPTRVILLPNVDRLSLDASSLLLKSIEDGPLFTKFLLTAATIGRVPETIRSRSHVIELTPVADEELAHGLAAFGYSKPKAREATRLAGGRPGLALRLLSDPNLFERYRSWEVFQSSLETSFRERSDLASTLDSPDAAEEFICFLQSRLRSGRPSLALLRRSREAIAMIHQHVPARLVLEYVLAGNPA